MEEGITFIARVDARGGVTMHPVLGELTGVQYGDIVEVSIKKREKSDWDEWMDTHMNDEQKQRFGKGEIVLIGNAKYVKIE